MTDQIGYIGCALMRDIFTKQISSQENHYFPHRVTYEQTNRFALKNYYPHK